MNATSLPTLSDAIRLVQAGELKPSDVWEMCSRQIQRLNPLLNAFITRLDLDGMGDLDVEAERMLSQKPLAGAPLAVKDLFETQGIRTTAGSLFFKDHIPSADAAAVERLRAAGARMIGKTNTHEIALGVTTVNPHFGTCRNPWNSDRISGGSSGGSAAAVATGMALAALGTDTGGSIRIPAALCGVVGLKPTFGRVSLRGVIPLSWNLDHVGPLTRTVTDAALMLESLAGYDQDDPASANVPVTPVRAHIEDGVRGWHVLRARGEYFAECEAEVAEAIDSAATLFARLGARVEEQDLSYLRIAGQANGLMTQADAAVFHRERLAGQPQLFGEDVRTRLETGRDLPLADYVLARRTQIEMRHRLDQEFARFDLILLPTTPATAPMIEAGDAVAQARSLTRFTAPFNLTGLPAISIPCGFSQEGLPIGMQLVCGAWNEAGVLQAARTYERETEWTRRRPQNS